MQKYFILFVLILVHLNTNGQLYLNESFNYPNYSEFKLKNLDKAHWTFFHTENQDFNQNERIDRWENIKSVDFIKMPDNNEVIKFTLKRMDSGILWNDVMVRGIIDSAAVDYHNFFTHIARNEIATWDDPQKTAYKTNKKYAFEFDIMVPDNFQFEQNHCQNPSIANYELTGQWHFSYDVRNGNTMSPISLRIVCDQWMLNLNPDNNPEEHDEDFIPLGKITRGKWTHWKIEFKLHHKNKGFIHVWKDGERVYSKEKTKTIFAKYYEKCNKSTVYFKLGVYKPHWWSRMTDVRERVFYYDNVRIYKPD